MIAAGREQLLAGSLEGVRLAEDLFAEYGNLVGADDQVVGVVCRECLGFFPGQSFYQVQGWLLRVSLFVYVGACPTEWQVQAGEQFAAIG
ncbi:hypothetical protein D3C77_576070 [compost metagenome]